MTYKCQFCGAEEGMGPDGILRAPCGQRMGRLMMEKYVCRKCRDRMAAALGALFEGGSTSDPTRCNMCLGSLMAGVFYAHKGVLVTGVWTRFPVCASCFAKYEKCCQENENGG